MDAIDVALVDTDGETHIHCRDVGVGTYDHELREILLKRLADPELASAPPPRDLVDAVTDAHCRAVEEMVTSIISPSMKSILSDFMGRRFFMHQIAG